MTGPVMAGGDLVAIPRSLLTVDGPPGRMTRTDAPGRGGCPGESDRTSSKGDQGVVRGLSGLVTAARRWAWDVLWDVAELVRVRVVARRRAADHRRARPGQRPRRWAAGLVGLLVGVALLAVSVRLAAGPVDWTPWRGQVREYGPVAVVGLLGLVAVAGGVRRLGPVRWDARDEQRVRPIRWWMMLLAVVVVVAAGWAAIVVLPSVLGVPTGATATTGVPGWPDEVGRGVGLAGLRVEVVRLGLAVATGAAGALLLAVTVRRQWLGERAQAHTEADARQRLIGEQYSKAAAQLGRDSDPMVRLGALESLEALAQANPDQRQRIVGLVCSLLRMPWEQDGQPASTPASKRVGTPVKPTTSQQRKQWREDEEERRVRLSAQRLLINHLVPHRSRWGRVRDQRFWPGIDFNLTGAHLVDFSAGGLEVVNAAFDDVTFTGTTSFDKAVFIGTASFGRTTFTDIAFFAETTFTEIAWFSGANFTDETLFGKATFTKGAWFRDANFAKTASFHGATFSNTAWFDKVTFADAVQFRGATFTNAVQFDGASFIKDAWFGDATFAGDAIFSNATFASIVVFLDATFSGTARFDGTVFAEPVRFDNAILNDDKGDVVRFLSMFIGGFDGRRVWVSRSGLPTSFRRPVVESETADDGVLQPQGKSTESVWPLGWTAYDLPEFVKRRGTGWRRLQVVPLVPVPVVLPDPPRSPGHLGQGVRGGAVRAARWWDVQR